MSGSNDALTVLSSSRWCAVFGPSCSAPRSVWASGWMRWPWARRSTCAAQQEATQLCSIHQSKGKEWRAVFLAGAEEGFVPHHHALQDDDALDGELRLMYVALTRVRERLYVSYCRQRERGGRRRVSAAVAVAVRPATRPADARRLAGVAAPGYSRRICHRADRHLRSQAGAPD